MADSAASTTPRAPRNGSTKRRTSTVSTDTENKLARAARSAQRLAQLTELPDDDSNLDLFPDDAARAAQQALSIDIRQGTLSGFELPNELLAAASAATASSAGGVASTVDVPVIEKAARRATRVARAERGVEVGADGDLVAAPVSSVNGVASAVSVASAEAVDDASLRAAVRDTSDGEAQMSSLEASVETVRGGGAVEGAAPAALATVAAPAMSSGRAESPASNASAASPALAGSVATRASAESLAPTDSPTSHADTSRARLTTAAPQRAAFAIPHSRSASADTPRVTPEIDHARATAFADTVDALYGVIADQRRASTEHSRRMKWLLSIVVCALLVTVAIGVAQTVLLMRLTHDSTLHEQRIEQMILNQQATLSTLLDTDSATVSAPAVTPPSAAAAPATQHASSAPSADTAAHHTAKTHHAHKPKQTGAH